MPVTQETLHDSAGSALQELGVSDKERQRIEIEGGKVQGEDTASFMRRDRVRVLHGKAGCQFRKAPDTRGGRVHEGGRGMLS